MFASFTFIKDFTSTGNSKFFFCDGSGFHEVTAHQIVSYDGMLVTHDYWMICEEIYNIAGCLPLRVVDLDEFRVLASSELRMRKEREKVDVIAYINKFIPSEHAVTAKYKKIFYAEVEQDNEVINNFHQLLLVYYIEICRIAIRNDEFRRFMQVEVPCQHICASISARGINVATDNISRFREDASHEYYVKLKKLSDKFDVPLQIPNSSELESYAKLHGVDIDRYSLDFITNYLPQIRSYADSVLQLREIFASREVLNSIAIKSDRVHPMVDTQGSRTSRLMVRNPFLQSLAKRYRRILTASQNNCLCYVDFDQFEVGIMAALSGDPMLLELYSHPDMYEAFRAEHLNGEGERKGAKILFLAYAYGMKRNNLPLVGASYGITKKAVREGFKKFTRYEKWKRAALEKLNDRGYVSTSLGNRFYIEGDIATDKEKLSAISQIVQGEGSLIFKKTLITVAEIDDVEPLLPMHDALLFQHSSPGTPEIVRKVFEDVMTQHFGKAIEGKASIEEFYEI